MTTPTEPASDELIAEIEAGQVVSVSGTSLDMLIARIKQGDERAEKAEDDRVWVIIRDVGCVPDRKGPFRRDTILPFLREAFAARPGSYIDVLTISDGVPDIQHGPEYLQQADGRSMSVGRRHNASINAAEASLAHGGVPEGWKLVAVEPTPEMLAAWWRYKNGHHFHDEPPPGDTSDYGAYRAMIDAAPKPPTLSPSEAAEVDMLADWIEAAANILEAINEDTDATLATVRAELGLPDDTPAAAVFKAALEHAKKAALSVEPAEAGPTSSESAVQPQPSPVHGENKSVGALGQLDGGER